MIVSLDPSSGPIAEAGGRPALRPDRVEAAVLGLVSNGLGRSDDLLRALADEVDRLQPVARVIAVRKPSVSVPPDPMDWEKLINEVTVAVAGFGG